MNYRVAAKGLLEVDGRILFIEYVETERTYYALPGGKHEIGETMQACVKREFYEELNLQVEVDNLLMVHEFVLGPNEAQAWPEGMHVVETVFKVTTDNLAELSIGAKPDLYMSRFCWLSKQDLQAVDYYPTFNLFELSENKQSIPYNFSDVIIPDQINR